MTTLPDTFTPNQQFALGLTPADVEEFRVILREECGEDLSLPHAWARATQVLSLFAYSLCRPDPDPPNGTP
jgi:hypothetical protein